MIKLPRKSGSGALCLWACFFPLLIGVGALDAQEKSFLWQVRSEKNTVYLLGSIHFLRKDSYPLKKVIEEAFENSKKLVLEIDLQSATPEKAQRVTLEKGMYRDGTTLRQNISEETYTLAERRGRELGIDLRAMHPLKPWVVAMTITALKLQSLGFDPNHGVDRYLADRAKSSDKPIGGLETLEYQIGLLDQLSPRDQESMLRRALTELDLLDQGVNRIIQSWAAGDLESLESILLASMREYPEVHQKIIVDRNRRWLPQIEKMIEQGERAMVVMGAAHLVGKNGVVELLKERGYRVEQQ